jgi:archaellum component FlaF (FlaF/FlaG flagellin family)
MKSKGIDTMIATILLIAFTVAVGGIISIWMTGYARTTGASVSSATENITACSNSYPYIVTVTTYGIIITNPGSENITSIRCFAANGTEISGGGTLGTITPGGTNTTGWNVTGGAKNVPYETNYGTKVMCTGSCRNIGVSGECKQGQTCWRAS